MLKHVVMFSGGVGSWATAKRVAELYGTDNLTLLFADVGGKHTSPHAGEDEDCYRFIQDAHQNVGGELVILNEGRDIWEVFKDNRFLGNSRLANCSKFLKQQPCREWLDANCDPDDTAVYVGIDWSETHRIPAIEKAYLPYVAFCPMTEPPYIGKEDMLDWCREEGLEPPRMYASGFPHANCGGGCVRAGQGQFKLLYEQNPERFAYWEAKEQELREYLDKDVAILRDRSRGAVAAYNEELEASGEPFKKATAVPLTLKTFRERLEEESSLVEADDIGGCGCFVDEPDPGGQYELDIQ